MNSAVRIAASRLVTAGPRRPWRSRSPASGSPGVPGRRRSGCSPRSHVGRPRPARGPWHGVEVAFQVVGGLRDRPGRIPVHLGLEVVQVTARRLDLRLGLQGDDVGRLLDRRPLLAEMSSERWAMASIDCSSLSSASQSV